MPRFTNLNHPVTTALIAATVICTVPGRALAQDVDYRPWSEILIVVGHDIALTLPDGYVEGKATAVTAESLELDVRSASNTSTYSRGHATIARSLVTVIRMKKSDDRAPRSASQTIGQAAVFGSLMGLGSRNNGLKGMAQGVGVSLGAATLGSVIGRKLDDRQIETVIRIVPEPEDVSGQSRPRAQATSRPSR